MLLSGWLAVFDIVEGDWVAKSSAGFQRGRAVIYAQAGQQAGRQAAQSGSVAAVGSFLISVLGYRRLLSHPYAQRERSRSVISRIMIENTSAGI